MKLLLVADPMIPVPPKLYGGIERIVSQLIDTFRQEGHEVLLVGLEGSTVVNDGFFPWPCPDVSSRWATFKNILHLRRVVLSTKPDLIHSFARLAYLGGLLRHPVPKVMSYQRIPGVRQTSWADRLSRGTLSFTGCSEYIKKLGARSGARWDAIHNFIDVEKLTFSPDVCDDAPLVFLSRLDRIKGPDRAIEIARQAKRTLILAGNRPTEGSDADFFDKEISPQIDGKSIQWIGPVDDVQKNELLGKAAAMVVPIRWDEPFGIVFAESLSCGTPVISAPRGALPEIVDHASTGFLINTIEEGVDAVHRLVDIDRTACRKVAEQRFSRRHIGLEYIELYRRRMVPISS